MKAYVLHGINDLRYEDVDMPTCPEGWAIVKVKAAGICSSDIPRIYTKGTYHFPTIPGHEFSGMVYSVGTDRDKALVGKHVGVFPLIPCRTCPQCQDKLYEMCSIYDYIGSRRDGGFAEYVAVPCWNLLVLPENVDYITGAMLEPLSVAYHAMKIAEIKYGYKVGIIGTGMIGICAGQWAKSLGAAEVTVMGRSGDKRGLVESCGLRYDILSDNMIPQYDIVLEAVGTPTAIESALAVAKPAATVVLMGNPSGDISLKQNVYWSILRKQLCIKGTWNSQYDGANASDWTKVIEALAAGQVKVDTVITHTFPKEDMMKALSLMKNHAETFCKVMTVW